MSGIFQINKVYVNNDFCLLASKRMQSSLLFWTNCYKANPETCPWPKARKEYAMHIERWYGKMLNYIVPVRRTQCFLVYKTGEGVTWTKKIRKDTEGNEYIIVEGIKLSACDISDESKENWCTKFSRQQQQRRYELRFIEKLAHLEEYGYVYRDNLEKVVRIEDLEAAYNRKNNYIE